MNVSLTPELAAFIQEEVKNGHYSTENDVIRFALSRLKEEKAPKQEFIVETRQELERKLVKGMESGPAKRLEKADWDRLRRRVKSRLVKPEPD